MPSVRNALSTSPSDTFQSPQFSCVLRFSSFLATYPRDIVISSTTVWGTGIYTLSCLSLSKKFRLKASSSELKTCSAMANCVKEHLKRSFTVVIIPIEAQISSRLIIFWTIKENVKEEMWAQYANVVRISSNNFTGFFTSHYTSPCKHGLLAFVQTPFLVMFFWDVVSGAVRVTVISWFYDYKERTILSREGASTRAVQYCRPGTARKSKSKTVMKIIFLPTLWFRG